LLTFLTKSSKFFLKALSPRVFSTANWLADGRPRIQFEKLARETYILSGLARHSAGVHPINFFPGGLNASEKPTAVTFVWFHSQLFFFADPGFATTIVLWQTSDIAPWLASSEQRACKSLHCFNVLAW